MNKTFLMLAGLATLFAPGIAHAGKNRVTKATEAGGGFARVVRVGNKDVVEVQEMPRMTAVMQCKESGWRVSMVGPHAFPTNATARAHTWRAPVSSGPSAKQFGDACRAGAAAIRLPVEVRGRCKRVKGIRVANEWAHRKVPVAFALDCRGYGDPYRDALIQWRHPQRNDPMLIPASYKKYAEALGYERVAVVGEVWRKPNNVNKSLVMGGRNEMRGILSDEALRDKLRKTGWSVGTKELGYVSPKGGPGKIPLHVYYNATRKDYAASCRASDVEGLVSDGYEHVGITGYVFPVRG